MTSGGKRKGAGRPRKPDETRRVTLSCRVHPDTLKWLISRKRDENINIGDTIDLAILMMCRAWGIKDP